MNKVPVVFSFDDNLVLPAGICITSLLENALPTTFYDIFILHDNSAAYPRSGFLERLYERFTNFKITYRSVGNQFKDAFEIRGVTVATYYRLLIPELIPEYNKIMYHDVDIIFRNDLTEIFQNTDLSNYYVAGVISPGFLKSNAVTERALLGLDSEKYILAGNIILNSALLREDQIVQQFKEQAKNNYKHQDMDVINIVCKGKTIRIPPVFCGTIEMFQLHRNNIEQSVYTSEELSVMENHGIVHYNGPKPWNTWCPNFDIWWEYYRKSVYYDSKFYFDFFYAKRNEYDSLSLWKRLKILFRYFKVGVVKS